MSTLFLHADVQNPYTAYHHRLAHTPVYWDADNKLWAVYSYAACKTILQHAHAHIPAVDAGNTHGLNEYALIIKEHLVRLQNNSHHAVARSIAMQLFRSMKPVGAADVTEQLIGAAGSNLTIDWVTIIGKQLPVWVLLKSFDFNEADAVTITAHMSTLTTIMLPNKTPEQVNAINAVVSIIYRLVEKQLLRKELPITAYSDNNNIVKMCVSNIIGLFIQSYDAGRGLLSNVLLQLLQAGHHSADKTYLHKSVVETLRFNPPVHNTRRVAAGVIELNDVVIKKGDAILLVLAAANRDPLQFTEPDSYNIDRVNNHEHLSFGTGAHSCIATHFIVNLAVECFEYIFSRFTGVELLEPSLAYEPLVNVRLLRNMWVQLVMADAEW